MDWSDFVFWQVLVCWGELLLFVVWFGSLTNLCDRVINQ